MDITEDFRRLAQIAKPQRAALKAVVAELEAVKPIEIVKIELGETDDLDTLPPRACGGCEGAWS